MGSTFNVVHISDLHFGADAKQLNPLNYMRRALTARGIIPALRRGIRQGTHDPDVARKAAKFILDNAEDQDLLVVTGDLACVGVENDLRTALSFLNAAPSARVPFLAEDGTASLQAGEFNVLVIPGNHDRYVRHDGTPGGTAFDQVFRSHWPQSPVFSRTVQSDAGDHLAVIGVDLSLRTDADADFPSFVNRFGQGRATAPTIAALVAETRLLRSLYPGVGICWAVHFPISLAGCGAGRAMRLRGAERVEAAAIQEGVGLLLSGHVHEPHLLQSGPLTVMCAGAATTYDEHEGNFIHFLEVEVDDGRTNLAKRTDYRYSAVADEFVLAGGFILTAA